MPKPRVLWIEDGAAESLKEFAGVVFEDGRYDLEIALDATDGCRQIREREFDAVIVDIRIPPGNDSLWTGMYKNLGQDKYRAKLGLHVLEHFLKPGQGTVVPKWATPQRFGVLTVETPADMTKPLADLGITVYEQKTAATSNGVLLKMIKDIIHPQKGQE